MRRVAGILLVALPVCASGTVSAQEPRPLYLIHQEVAKPSQQPQYEAAAKEFVALFSRNRAAMPHFNFIGLQSDDFTYTYVTRIPSFGGIDGIFQDFGALAQKEGQVFAELSKRSGATTEHIRESVVSLAPELSYTPATPRMKPEDAKYLHYDIYYVMPGREADADAIAKEFLALFKSKNIANAYRVFKAELASEMPALYVEVGAKDAADYHTQLAADQAALGEAAKALFAKAFAITRRFETRSGWLRPDLSLPATAPAK
jgi:hypothetical protein